MYCCHFREQTHVVRTLPATAQGSFRREGSCCEGRCTYFSGSDIIRIFAVSNGTKKKEPTRVQMMLMNVSSYACRGQFYSPLKLGGCKPCLLLLQIMEFQKPQLHSNFIVSFCSETAKCAFEWSQNGDLSLSIGLRLYFMRPRSPPESFKSVIWFSSTLCTNKVSHIPPIS